MSPVLRCLLRERLVYCLKKAERQRSHPLPEREHDVACMQHTSVRAHVRYLIAKSYSGLGQNAAATTAGNSRAARMSTGSMCGEDTPFLYRAIMHSECTIAIAHLMRPPVCTAECSRLSGSEKVQSRTFARSAHRLQRGPQRLAAIPTSLPSNDS